MQDAAKLLSYIEDEAAREARNMLKDSERAYVLAVEQTRKKLDQWLMEQRKDMDRQAEERMANEARHGEVLRKRNKVKRAETYVSQLFDELQKNLKDSSFSDWAPLLGKVVKEVPAGSELCMGQLTWINMTEQDKNSLLTLAGENGVVWKQTILEHSAGFLFRQGKVEYSFLLKDLLERVQDEEAPRCIQKLIG